MSQSKIEWTELTWNPTTGCNKISAGCKFCYAEVMSKRLHAMGVKKYKDNFKLRTHTSELETPYGWRKPRIVFVNSMSDLFHKDVPLEFIKRVFKVMNDNPQHTFQVLTKRAELVLKYNKELNWTKNIWMGVSIESNKFINRVELLKKTNAKTKFLSVEPLIADVPDLNVKGINWVIVGGESGPKARALKEDWILNVLKKCQKENIPFFFKQWGKTKFNPDQLDPTIDVNHPEHAKGGCMLKGKIYRNMPIIK
jgi:protein gp37